MDPSRHEWLELSSDIFKALSHPARFELLQNLSDGPRCICDMAGPLGLAPSLAAKYVAQLRQAGLIEMERKGARIEYRLVTPCVLELAECAVKAVLANRKS